MYICIYSTPTICNDFQIIETNPGKQDEEDETRRIWVDENGPSIIHYQAEWVYYMITELALKMGFNLHNEQWAYGFCP